MIKLERLPEHNEEAIRALIKEHGGLVLTHITNEAYHQGPGISSSDIKEVVDGTLASWIEKKSSNKLPTESQLKGSAIHTYLLERDQFWLRYCEESEYPLAPLRTTKEGKETFAKWQEETGNVGTKLESDEWKAAYVAWAFPEFKKEVISKKNLEMLEQIEKSVKTHEELSLILEGGDSEVSYFWIDDETDILCKARADKLNYDFPCIPDLKSCMDASPDAFESNITNYNYYVSAYWYLWGAKKVFNHDFVNFVYVPIEKEAPYQATLYITDEGSLSLGEGLARAGLLLFSDYFNAIKADKKVWLGHSKEIKSIGVKSWAFNKLSQVIYKHDLQGRGLEKFIG